MVATLPDQSLTLNTTANVILDSYTQGYIDWIVFINHSPFALHAAVGGNIIPIPAWYYYPVSVVGMAPQQVSVLPYLQTIPGKGFTNTLSVFLYMKGEVPNTLVPQPLGGGPIDLTIASSVQSINQPLGTNMVFGVPFGDSNAGGATNINNSGFATFGDNAASGQVQVGGALGVLTLLPNTIKESAASLNFDTDIASDVLIFKNAGAEIMRIIAGAIAPNAAPTIINGSVSGTISFYTPLWGSGLKILIVDLINYQSANVASFNVPSAMGHVLFGFADNIGTGTFSLFSGGTAQNLQQLLTLGTQGAAGSFGTSITSMPMKNIFVGINSWTQIQVGTISSGQTGGIIIIGV